MVVKAWEVVLVALRLLVANEAALLVSCPRAEHNKAAKMKSRRLIPAVRRQVEAIEKAVETS